MAKVKVVNHNGFDYGLVINLSGEPRRITVKKNSFIMLEKDEIYQIDSTSRTFRVKKLKRKLVKLMKIQMI
jgi:hypothetical protein